MAVRAMLLMLLILATILTVRLGDCAFLRVESATVLRGGGAAGSQFGYRVAVVRDASGARTHHLLVSDPTAVDRTTGFSSGAVYRCPISARDFSTTKPICRDSELTFVSPDGVTEVYRNVTQFGASISTLPGGQFVVCAPGHNFATLHNQTATTGLCAYWQSVGSEPRWLQKFFQAGSTDPKDRMFSNCMGGFQAELLSSADGPRLAVSGPFCMLRRLAVVSATGSSNKAVKFESANAHDYLGFSLAADRASTGGFVYATLPHTNVQSDGITFMVRIQSENADLKNAQRIVARVGSQFYNWTSRSYNYIGYSSATVSVSENGIHKSAVVLGAPFESDVSKPNRGCVIVVPVGLEDETVAPVLLDGIPVRFCGTDAGGRLGTSVVNIGDVNHDGSDDFAVGCPGCGANGTGAVYLFLGLSNYRASGDSTPQLKPFEIVHAANVSSELSGFGWSLAMAGDLDGNGAGELVASAVSSGHVVVLPGRVILNTSIDLRYATGASLSDITISQFSDAIKGLVAMTITMKAGPDFDLTRYHFNLDVRLQESAEEAQYKRFDIEVMDCATLTENWCQLTRSSEKMNQATFKLRFKLKVLSNVKRHMPVSQLLRDLNLLLEWRMLNRTVPSGSNFPFPAILYKNHLYPNYENEVTVRLFGFKGGVCLDSFCKDQKTGSIQLKLLNNSALTLNSFQPITVVLSVKKISLEPYYGGAAVQMNMSQGVLVLSVEVKQDKQNFSKVNYWSEHREVLLTEPYPVEEDFLNRQRRGEMTVHVKLKFDGHHSNYQLNFNLVNIMAKEGYQEYVTNDTQLFNKSAFMEVKFNTTLMLKLLSQTDDSTVVDTRERSDKAALLSLKGLTEGNKIGPALQHTYELYAVTKPLLPVHSLSLTVRLPFVTSDNNLLLYFPRSTISSGSSQLPGLPFLSDSIDGVAGTGESECRPEEDDLAQLLFKPDLVLLDKKHRANVSARARRDVSSLEQEGRRSTEGLTSSPLDSLNASVSMATTNAESLPGVDKIDKVPVFECQQPENAPLKFRCITFKCNVRTMNQNGLSSTADRVFLHIHAKIWSPTFFAAHLQSFSIRSDITLNWQRSPAFKYVEKAENSSAKQMFLFLNLKPPMVSEIPWGYIVLAVCIGIWLLMLCILLMWYFNFFKRRQFDYSAVPSGPEAAAAAGDDDFYH